MHPILDSARRVPSWAVLPLLVALVATACDASPAPSASVGSVTPAAASAAVVTPMPSALTSAVPATPEPTTSPAPGGDLTLEPGAIAVTVTDGLRARSAPRVAEDSLEFTPLLPKGTSLVVLGGPVRASGFTWLEVAPIDTTLNGGVDAGWVAVADHDGTPWVAPSTDATPGFDLASAPLSRTAGTLADAKIAAAAQNAFGIALYRRLLRDPELGLATKGVVMSPYSIMTALAMARAGAAGTTATQMDKVLGVKGWNRLGTGLGALDQRLTSRNAGWVDYEGAQHWLALRTANTAFGQRDYAIKAAYLERIAGAFGAALGLVDFIKDTDGARKAINDWVKRQTLGRIPELLGPEDVTTATRLVLVNAVYLKAEWAHPFDPDDTTDKLFTTLDGRVVSVPTMHQFGGQDLVLAKGDGWRATELRYAGAGITKPLAITLIMPDDLATFERSLTPATLKTVAAQIAAEGKRLGQVTYPAGEQDSCGWYPYNVALALPKFGVETRANLNETLKTLGMPAAFDAGSADFSGITGNRSLYLAAVIHQANIDVDEKGTTAAAATAVLGVTGGCLGPAPRKTRTLAFNKPFLYLVRDVGTGAILFMGRVVDPSQR